MYKNRFDAAEKLSVGLMRYKNAKNMIILAIPRGGLEIGYVLSRNLNLPLDIIVVKKLGYPGNEEYAIGAVGKGITYINEEVVRREAIPQEYIRSEEKRLREEVEDRYNKYKGGTIQLKGKTIILCDDGIATGITMLLCVEILKKQKPKKIIVAVPVGPPDTIERLRLRAEEVYCPLVPEMFFAIGAFYENFPQVSDEEAIALLKKANEEIKNR